MEAGLTVAMVKKAAQPLLLRKHDERHRHKKKKKKNNMQRVMQDAEHVADLFKESSRKHVVIINRGRGHWERVAFCLSCVFMLMKIIRFDFVPTACVCLCVSANVTATIAKMILVYSALKSFSCFCNG